MKRCLLLCLVLVFRISFAGETADLNNKRLVILGDSITKGGRYASYMDYYLQRQGVKCDLISVGLGSETASGLSEKAHPYPRPCIHNRLDNILATLKPDIVLACYGMNDGIYHPQSRERFESYKKGINLLVQKCRAADAAVYIMTPPPFDPKNSKRPLVDKDAADFSFRTPYKDYDDVLADYAAWLMEPHKEFKAVDIHRIMTDYIEKERKTNPDFKFSPGNIHPNGDGHLLMARSVLEFLGYELSDKTLREESKTVNSDQLFRLIHRRRRLRSEGWLEFIGYTRGKTVKSEDKSFIKKAQSLQKAIDELQAKDL